jgi:two-component system, cell cycle sensor histidine kinase and response regulator CckA
VASALPALGVGLLLLTFIAFPSHLVPALRPILISSGLLLTGFWVLREWATTRTERALLERVRRQRDRYRELLHSAPLGIALVGERGAIEMVNPLFAQLLGSDVASVDHPRLREIGVAELVVTARAESRVRSLEATLPDGKTKVVVRAAPAADSTLLIVENVTEQRELLQQLTRAQKLEVVGALAGGIAHDFNNLLTAAMVGTSLARPESGDQEALDQVERALRQAAALTRRLLTLGRKQAPHLENIDPAVVAARALDTLKLGLPAHIALKRDLPFGLGRVLADPDQLEQAVLNLGLNARDALPEGGTITVELRRTDADGVSRAELSVADDGVGIEPSAVERIFEPFFTTKAPGAGTGLGLPMVATFAQRHGGSVGVSSRPGGGSRFTLSLPWVEEGAAVASEPAQQAQELIPGQGHILLVDDNEPALHAAESTLEACGYRLSLARSAAEALEIMDNRGEQIDLILTDAIMPGQSGAALLGELRQRGFRQPAAIVSAYEPEELREQGQSYPRLGKPYLPHELARLVHRLLQERAAQPSGGST